MSNSHSGKITLQPITDADLLRAHAGTMALGLDRFGRLRLGSAVTKRLALYGVSGRVYVSVDPAQRIVALRKYDEVDKLAGGARLFSVDKRGYISARWLYGKLGVQQDAGPWRFEFVGDIDDAGGRWLGFRLVSE